MKIPLLLLPGLLADARLFEPQVHGLADVASPAVAGLSSASTIAALAALAIGRMPAWIQRAAG